MDCIMYRTEVFGNEPSVEIDSYGERHIEDKHKALSAYKAEIIEEINKQRIYPSECTYKDYGKQKEDRFYVCDLSKSNYSNKRRHIDELKKAIFNGEHIAECKFDALVLPEGWEEITPENYVIVPVAFRKPPEVPFV